MNISHANLIEISENTSIGLTDSKVYLSVTFYCIKENCIYDKSGLCKIDDLMKASEDVQLEYCLDADPDGKVTVSMTYTGEYSYIDFLESIDIMNTKWREIDCFVECNCRLKNELAKAYDGFQNYLDSIITAVQRDF